MARASLAASVEKVAFSSASVVKDALVMKLASLQSVRIVVVSAADKSIGRSSIYTSCNLFDVLSIIVAKFAS